MSGQRFRRDDIVATVARIGHGIEKRRVGEVIEVGAHGCRVSFYDGEELWLPGGRLFHVVDRNGVQELTKERPADPPRRLRAVRNDEPEETANVRRNTDPTPAAAPASTTPAPTPAPPLAAIEASGVDPLAMWLALGTELVGRERRAVAAAEAAEASAAASVASAEELLATERRSLDAARTAAAAARVRLQQIVARVGGAS